MIVNHTKLSQHPGTDCYIGLMSGTSLDGVDGVLLDCSVAPPRVMAAASAGLPDAYKEHLFSLNSPGPNELHRAALAANQLVAIYTNVVHRLLEQAQSLGIKKDHIQAIGAHGQTVRHRPQEFGDKNLGIPGVGYTWQLNNPALLAELTGLNVVADFRTTDLAAGGQGAPLVPAFHQAMWGHTTQALAVLNLGGMSNLTLLPPQGPVQGFDCGPGNVLMDFWCHQHTGQAYDLDGAWAASGKVLPALLEKFLQDPYFSAPPPKSTGRDRFNQDWLSKHLQGFEHQACKDVQATLMALTAHVCAHDVKRYLPDVQALLVCGGGAHNLALMGLLQRALPNAQVTSTLSRGLPPQQVEAAAFAWLAYAWGHGIPGNLASVTGAKGPRVLGACYKTPSSALI